jgi:anti-sigma B factor antagonist
MAEFTTRQAHDGLRSLAVSGDFDIASVERFLAQAQACLNDAPDLLEIDLAAVTFIDSSGLGALVRMRNLAGDSAKTLTFVNIPPSVNRLFEVTGLAETFGMRSGD